MVAGDYTIVYKEPKPIQIEQWESEGEIMETDFTKYGWGERIVSELRNAIYEASRVAAREHIKATRIERVGIFATIIRSKIRYVCKPYNDHNQFNVLTNKAIWDDIGVLRPQSVCNHYFKGSVTYKKVSHWLKSAHMEKLQEEAAISANLDAMKESIAYCESLASHAKEINVESDNLLKKIETFYAGEEKPAPKLAWDRD